MKFIETLRKKAFNWLAGDSVNGPQYGTSYGRRSWSTPDYRYEFNSIVTGVLGAIQRSFLEAPCAIVKEGDAPNYAHPLCALIANPSNYEGAGRINGLQLLKATVACRAFEGNAYWYKVRSGPRVIGLEFLRFDQCRPVSVPGNVNALSHYEVKAASTGFGGLWTTVPKEDIVHFADGLNPIRPLEGMSPLNSCVREVCADNEAVRFMAAIVRNPSMGVMLSPADPAIRMSPDDAAMLAEHLEQKAGGVNAGKTIVPLQAMKADKFGLSPEELALDTILRLPEQRITAVFGVPAIVVGLGAGLERSTFANYAEAREAFTETVLIPLWREIAQDIDGQLFQADFVAKAGETFAFDISQVRALQQDEDALYKRITDGWNAGLLTRGQCMNALGQAMPPGMAEDEVKTSVSPAPAVSEPQKAWVQELARKWQQRAAS